MIDLSGVHLNQYNNHPKMTKDFDISGWLILEIIIAMLLVIGMMIFVYHCHRVTFNSSNRYPSS